MFPAVLSQEVGPVCVIGQQTALVAFDGGVVEEDGRAGFVGDGVGAGAGGRRSGRTGGHDLVLQFLVVAFHFLKSGTDGFVVVGWEPVGPFEVEQEFTAVLAVIHDVYKVVDKNKKERVYCALEQTQCTG